MDADRFVSWPLSVCSPPFVFHSSFEELKAVYMELCRYPEKGGALKLSVSGMVSQSNSEAYSVPLGK